jgi:hypothetical protein
LGLLLESYEVTAGCVPGAKPNVVGQLAVLTISKDSLHEVAACPELSEVAPAHEAKMVL